MELFLTTESTEERVQHISMERAAHIYTAYSFVYIMMNRLKKLNNRDITLGYVDTRLQLIKMPELLDSISTKYMVKLKSYLQYGDNQEPKHTKSIIGFGNKALATDYISCRCKRGMWYVGFSDGLKNDINKILDWFNDYSPRDFENLSIVQFHKVVREMCPDMSELVKPIYLDMTNTGPINSEWRDLDKSGSYILTYKETDVANRYLEQLLNKGFNRKLAEYLTMFINRYNRVLVIRVGVQEVEILNQINKWELIRDILKSHGLTIYYITE